MQLRHSACTLMASLLSDPKQSGDPMEERWPGLAICHSRYRPRSRATLAPKSLTMVLDHLWIFFAQALVAVAPTMLRGMPCIITTAALFFELFEFTGSHFVFLFLGRLRHPFELKLVLLGWRRTRRHRRQLLGSALFIFHDIQME